MTTTTTTALWQIMITISKIELCANIDTLYKTIFFWQYCLCKCAQNRKRCGCQFQSVRFFIMERLLSDKHFEGLLLWPWHETIDQWVRRRYARISDISSSVWCVFSSSYFGDCRRRRRLVTKNIETKRDKTTDSVIEQSNQADLFVVICCDGWLAQRFGAT